MHTCNSSGACGALDLGHRCDRRPTMGWNHHSRSLAAMCSTAGCHCVHSCQWRLHHLPAAAACMPCHLTLLHMGAPGRPPASHPAALCSCPFTYPDPPYPPSCSAPPAAACLVLHAHASMTPQQPSQGLRLQQVPLTATLCIQPSGLCILPLATSTAHLPNLPRTRANGRLLRQPAIVYQSLTLPFRCTYHTALQHAARTPQLQAAAAPPEPNPCTSL